MGQDLGVVGRSQDNHSRNLVHNLSLYAAILVRIILSVLSLSLSPSQVFSIALYWRLL